MLQNINNHSMSKSSSLLILLFSALNLFHGESILCLGKKVAIIIAIDDISGCALEVAYLNQR
jgi:hypothetical protein